MDSAVLLIIFYIVTIVEIAVVLYACTVMKTPRERIPLIVAGIVCVMVLLFASPLASAHAVRNVSPLIPMTHSEHILEKVKEGNVICEQVPLAATVESSVTIQENGTKFVTQRIVERPIALCAYSEASKSWEVIHLALRYPVSETYISCVKTAQTLLERKNCVLPLRVITPGYVVDHLRGYGITRFIADVYKEKSVRLQHGDESLAMSMRGEKLTVYRTRHMWFDNEALASKDVDRIIATATAKNYTPDHPDFADDELADIGVQFLFGKLREVRQALGTNAALTGTVRSRAFPDRALAVAVPWEIPMSLAVIEQIDDMPFGVDSLGEVKSKLREYALNREEAFKWSQSGANAIGALQFTDADGNGTYSAMVREYPGASIEPNFQIGARDLANVLKSAYALIDHEVAQFPEIKPIFKKNPKRGGAFPVAAYNGGPRSGEALYTWLKKRGWSIERKNLEFPQVLMVKKTEQCPCRSAVTGKIKKKGTIVRYVPNTETPGYLVKYFFLLNYLADKNLE